MIQSSQRYILYVGPFSFPNGGAAARRVLGNCQSLKDAGFPVIVASGQLPDEAIAGEFRGVKFLSLGERDAEKLPRWLKRLAYFRMGNKTIRWLSSLQEKPYAIILYSGYSPYLLKFIPWTKRNQVKLIFDAVEWYDPESLLHRFSPYQLNIEFAMRCLLPRVPNIIAISSYLESYYQKRGAQCVIVPPTLDVKNTEFRMTGRDVNKPLALVYAGSPGKKDLLNNIMEAVFRLRFAGHDLRLAVAGITSSDAANYLAVRTRSTKEVSAGVDFKGVLSHSDSIALVRDSDFSLLLRMEARYSRAGFPTKFVESFAVGTPVISNITSDLAKYLLDNETGFICEGPTAANMESALLRALQLSQSDHVMMRTRCRESAVCNFDFRIFSSPLSSFLSSARL